jgi:hypothetical protein
MRKALRPYLPPAPPRVPPPWVFWIAYAVCGAGLLLGHWLLLQGLLMVEQHPGQRWGKFGGAFGCIVGCLGGLLGARNSQRMCQGAVHVFYELKFSGLDLGILGYGLVGILFLGFSGVNALRGGLWDTTYGAALLGFLATVQGGTYLVVRWRILQTARALFTLYLDGELTPEETLAIDAARQEHPAFDRAVKEFDAVNQTVRAWARG